MEEKYLRDSLDLAHKTILELQNVQSKPSVWFWICIGQLLLILLIIVVTRKRSKTRIELTKIKNDILSSDVDFDNLINSSFNSTQLYNTLKVKCHPDRFTQDPEKNRIALLIFQEVSKNRTNIKRLEQLKVEAMQKLNISF